MSSAAMSVPVPDQQSDQIGARETLQGLLNLRSALLLLDGGRSMVFGEASLPADAPGEEPSSSSCWSESERVLVSEVQVRFGTEQE